MKKIIETERLYLRELTINDKFELSKILSDTESMRFYDHPYSMEEVENWIQWNLDNYKKYNHGLWAVILKYDDTFLGDCGITIQEIENEKLPELGYHIKKEYWNKGYATEAAIACKNYAFDVLKMDKLYTYTTTDNLPSRKVAEKNGMIFQRKFIKKLYGNDVEEVLYCVHK
jgi:RimJ/RimL family protein N-acetyltransferase